MSKDKDNEASDSMEGVGRLGDLEHDTFEDGDGLGTSAPYVPPEAEEKPRPLSDRIRQARERMRNPVADALKEKHADRPWLHEDNPAIWVGEV